MSTPYYIDCSRENVKILQNDPKARWQGYQYFFREGFCWSDIHTVLIKSRLKINGVHDVKSMSLFSVCNLVPETNLITVLNSALISHYDFNFVNNTQTFQINDARQLPIIIPTQLQLGEFQEVFNQAFIIQKSKFENTISRQEAEIRLAEVQAKVDSLVYRLYGLNHGEFC